MVLIAMSCLATLLYMLRRDFRVDLGAPTPKEAEARTTEAVIGQSHIADAAAQRIRDAVLSEKIAVARAYAERGMRKP